MVWGEVSPGVSFTATISGDDSNAVQTDTPMECSHHSEQFNQGLWSLPEVNQHQRHRPRQLPTGDDVDQPVQGKWLIRAPASTFMSKTDQQVDERVDITKVLRPAQPSRHRQGLRNEGKGIKIHWVS